MTSSSTSPSPPALDPEPDFNPDDDLLFEAHYSPPPQHASRPSSSSSSSSAGSPPPLQHNFFAPPFYNRPPTPLPPSPSLTSLLRPSRPTTPDSSADELEPPVPRASPKVPTYEYYGFVLYLFSSLTFLLYLLWSYLPSPFLHALGICYYPNRWWSLALPSWIVMALVWIYVALAGYNTGYLTLGLGEVGGVVDGAGMVCGVDGRGVGVGDGKEKGKRDREREREREKGRDLERDVQEWKRVWSKGTDAVMDVPLGGVCEILYGVGRERSESEEDEDEFE
ncbi:hypothetical protein CJF31_00008131 [Rutstroemia sp. NJR-2017a BVV2]|nr:hypothetical protein CJF31_00008131 [Rutstroemia sp. NJR-2017a BVV2]